MQIAIFGGTGSLGAYFAYRLVKAQHNVTIIGRDNSPNLKQIAEIGLTIKFYNETVFVPNSDFAYVGAYNQILSHVKQDLVIISLKQPNLDLNVAYQIMNLTDSHSIVGVISNGLPFYFLADCNLRSKTYINSVDEQGKIYQLMQNHQIMTVMPLMGSNVESPGVIRVVNQPDKIKTFIDGKFIDNSQLDMISQIFSNASIPNIISEDINKKILEKLQFSLAVNAISALLDQYNGQVFHSESNQNYVRYVISFVKSLAEALGVGNVRDYDTFKVLNISEARYSSMYEDLVNGKMPEVKVIISAPVEIAHHFNISVSTKPLEILEELILSKSRNITLSSEQIHNFYYEAEMALNETEVLVNVIGEEYNF